MNGFSQLKFIQLLALSKIPLERTKLYIALFCFSYFMKL